MKDFDLFYADLEKLALECEPFKCFIDPDSPEFGSMGNIPKRVQEYCERTGQYIDEKWTCMDFNCGTCSKLEDTPCNECFENNMRGFERRGVKCE